MCVETVLLRNIAEEALCMLVSHNFAPLEGYNNQTYFKFSCYIMSSPLRYHIVKEAGCNEDECIEYRGTIVINCYVNAC